MINELATNAMKYSLGERDAARVSVQVFLDDDEVKMAFRDDGPGYPEEVFRSKQYNLGLDLVQRMVHESLNGELSLQNDAGAVTESHFLIGR